LVIYKNYIKMHSQQNIKRSWYVWKYILITTFGESMWKVWCAIRMWKHDMCCSVAVYVLQPFKGQYYWTDASDTFSSQMCQVMLKHTRVRVWAASASQYSREFFPGPLFMGINLLFVSSCTTRCSGLGTYTLKSANLNLINLVVEILVTCSKFMLFFSTYFLCIVLTYLIFLFVNGT
jgi:hypothetical protein